MMSQGIVRGHILVLFLILVGKFKFLTLSMTLVVDILLIEFIKFGKSPSYSYFTESVYHECM